jgi:predicted O-methyltransferase YrrM
MNSVLKHIYEIGRVEDSEGNLIDPFPAATPLKIGMFLGETIQKYQLKNTLEIGMAYGLSSLFICQAHHDTGSGYHTAIDPTQSTMWKSIGLLNIKRAGLENKLRFLEDRSERILPQLYLQGEKIDFAFIDGNHLFDYTLVEFFYLDRILTLGGYIVFDDLWMPSVRKVVSFVLRNRSYELIPIKIEKNVTTQIGRIAKRFLQNPLELNDLKLKLLPNNVCLLKKISEDKRKWNFHHYF